MTLKSFQTFDRSDEATWPPTYLSTYLSEISSCDQEQPESEKILEVVPTGFKKFSCSSCGYLCSNSFYLKRHTRVHTGEKPYKCTQCDFSCAYSSNFTRHMRKHTGGKPYSCTQCDLSFARSRKLARHMRIHSNRMHTID